MSLLLPLHRIASRPEHVSQVRLGMPHLTLNGLSETWLLKELGDIHWQVLAQSLGRPAAGIADRDGNRVYAAFRIVRVEDARFAEAREDESLSVRSSLWRLSRTQVISRHNLSISGHAVGRVTLVSAFIRREGGSNHKVCRVEVPGLSQLPAWDGPQPAAMPPRPQDAPDDEGLLFLPCPGEDFNGAGFLYFSSYVAIAERAAFALHPDWGIGAATVERTVCYYGNVDAGAALRARVFGTRSSNPETLKTSTRLCRDGDGACLAMISTVKRRFTP